jgi:hypothetical protein
MLQAYGLRELVSDIKYLNIDRFVSPSGSHCFYQLPLIAAASCEVHLIHHHCDGQEASCTMEELVACRGWVDTDLYRKVLKNH